MKRSDKNFSPNTDLIPYWLLLLKKIPWRADQFCWIFNEFKNNEVLKNQLLILLDTFKSYEWIRNQIYTALAVSQTIAKKDWVGLFRKLKTEDAYYARNALYKLLIYHLSDKQQLLQVTQEIAKENNHYMRKELLFYASIKQSKQFHITELIKSFGL